MHHEVSAKVHRDFCPAVLLRRAGGAHLLGRGPLGGGRGRHHAGQLQQGLQGGLGGEHPGRPIVWERLGVPPPAGRGALGPPGRGRPGGGDGFPNLAPQLLGIRIQFPARGQTGPTSAVQAVGLEVQESPVEGLQRDDGLGGTGDAGQTRCPGALRQHHGSDQRSPTFLFLGGGPETRLHRQRDHGLEIFGHKKGAGGAGLQLQLSGPGPPQGVQRLLGSPVQGLCPFLLVQTSLRPLQPRLAPGADPERRPGPSVRLHRSGDLEAIGRVIGDARRFVYISVTDYLPLLDAGTTRYWSQIDGYIREALILRGVRVRLLIACREDTRPLTFNFVRSLSSLCLEQNNCSLEAKFFEGRVQKDGSLREVNHNKFVVTERDLYLGNLDWVGNEFTYNAGIGLVVSQPRDVRWENSSRLVEQLRVTFERDWFSSYAHSPQTDKFYICGKHRMNRMGPVKDGRVDGKDRGDGKGQEDRVPGKENGQETHRNLTHPDWWSTVQINDSKEPDGPSPESIQILNGPL
ncbi:uncharacterized protein LOC144205244 isoform X3 [Stigmatopora nigra]